MKCTCNYHRPYSLRPSLVLLVFFYISIGAQDVPKQYIAQKTTDSIQVDGEAKEASWGKVEWSADFIDIEGQKSPRYRTRMKMLWDDTYLYFFAQMEEPHVWGNLKKRDTVIFYNNDFEIFIDPDGDTHNYYEFEMNALNTVWDLFLTRPYRNRGKVIDSWDIQGLKTAVHIDGTINDSDDQDNGWSVEIAIPWNVLTEASTSNKVPKNQFWRINFSRVNWDFDLKNGKYSRKKDGNGNFLPEYNWVWSPQGVINMHEPEHWGYVFFSEDGRNEFEIPKDDYLKWYLYGLARKLWAAEKENENNTEIPELEQNFEFEGRSIPTFLNRYENGWSVTIRSPFSNKILSVSQDGKFTRYDQKE